MQHEWLNSWLDCGSLIALNDGNLLLGSNKTSTQNLRVKTAAKFFVTDFFLKSKSPWIYYKDYHVFTKEELFKILADFKKALNSKSLPSREWTNSHEWIFQENFEFLKDQFSKNELVKAVPYVFDESEGKVNKEELIEMLIHGLSYVMSHSAYLYGSWDENGGILGATPEILFREKDGTLETMACAGTEKKDVSIQQFMEDPKQRLEHKVVVDSLVSSLSEYGDVHVGNCKVLELPSLNHLVTEVSLKYKDSFSKKQPYVEDLIELLHPTPALGAFPKISGAKWLKSYEDKIPRKKFGAPFGVCFNGAHTVYVAIRNVQWDKEKMFMGAGAGIVSKSRYDHEFSEIQLKLKAIKQMLGL